MASNRGNDFPVTSIGRSSGSRLQLASAAHEAHPLLSPGSSPTPSTKQATGAGGAVLSVNGEPRYVPYTPRQRVTPTSATTGTTVHPSSPQQHQGDATSKLQIMHLKAAAQAIGLDSGTLGWSILEKLVLEPEVSEDWVEVWSTITSGKATLLLPLESASNHGKLTAEFVKDHLVLSDSASRKNAPVITLSGLRGTLEDETLAFRSTINPTSKLFQDILAPSTRPTALSLVPPLPSLPDATPIAYPEYTLPSYTPSLHLPPRAQIGPKPPLPPRPGSRPAPSTQSSSSRISLPFVSLFGGHSSKTTTPAPASPPASLRSFDSSQDNNGAVELPAFTIDRKIVRKDLAKELNRAVKGEVKVTLANTASLNHVPIPSWVMDRLHGVTADWYPFFKKTSSASSLQMKLGGEKGGKDGNSNGYIVNTLEENPDDAAEHLQDFYLALEQDMRSGGQSFIPRWKERLGGDTESEADDEKDREQREQDRMESETRIREVMEAIEQTIMTVFYDRLFMQPTTDDASHDEALSTRIAALNMLDLRLGHLGIEVPKSVDETALSAVIKECGDLLTRLDACYSPSEKSALLVAAHKAVVDGLSKLPPIRLISEHDKSNEVEDDLPTARPKFTPDGQPKASLAEAQSTAPLTSGDIPVYSATAPKSQPVDIPSKNTMSSSKPKGPPPALLLDTSVSTPEQHTALASDTEKSPPVASRDPTPVSGDVLLPLIIFSVVKANPPHLVSNLLFIQRFRNQAVGGEESYCLINMLAVAEFLENVDMGSLGLGDNDKVMSTADLTPITLTRSPVTGETPLEPADQGLRGRVGQQVDAITDSANKVITGVVDSSFGILRSFMPTTNTAASGPASSPGTPVLGSLRPGFGLLRRESGFSIASLAASLPIAGRSRSNTATEESGQQLLTVSRPSSARSRASARSFKVSRDEDDDDDSQDESEDAEESSAADDDDDEEEEEEDAAAVTDTRSIRSFESMLSASKKKRSHSRKSLSDRLATVSALAGLKGGTEASSRRASLLHQNSSHGRGSPSSSRAVSPGPTAPLLQLAPPKQRFLNCAPDDLRMSEIAELLRDYRRLVEGIRSIGGFEE